jgi:hypothetical protein
MTKRGREVRPWGHLEGGRKERREGGREGV